MNVEVRHQITRWLKEGVTPVELLRQVANALEDTGHPTIAGKVDKVRHGVPLGFS